MTWLMPSGYLGAMFLLLVAALAQVLPSADGFSTPHATILSRCHLQVCFSAAEGTNSESQQVQYMEDLILSLSVDANDASRRNKVASLFDEKLKNREGSESFVQLFDQVLITVGDRVRIEAASQKQGKTKNENSELSSFPLPVQQKSQTELQLWALIDMMVQSKTLIKKAAGQWGSERSFG